ncbi:RDD family protein [Akkermansiaceae bacterium]|nr:RDD family protein [Akkermansiaceae bacterium]
MVTLEVSSCEVRAITIKTSTMSEENPYSPPVNQVEAPPIQSAVPGLHNYASLGQRLLGKIIDGLIMIPLGLVIGVGYALISPPKLVAVEKLSDVFLGGASVYGLGETLLLAVLGMAAYIGVQWAFWASTGQSIGKKVMKTQVVNLDGSQASVQTIAFKRYGIINLIANVPTFGPLVHFIGVLLIFRQNRNCLHDDIAKTRVIKFVASS